MVAVLYGWVVVVSCASGCISAVRCPTHAKGLAAAVKTARALSDSLTFEVTALPFVNQELRHISGQQQHCVGPVQ